MPVGELSHHRLDRALRPEGLAAADAVEGLLLLEHRLRGVPGGDIEPGDEAEDRVLGAGRGAQPALDAERFGEAQHRPLGIVGQRRASGRR